MLSIFDLHCGVCLLDACLLGVGNQNFTERQVHVPWFGQPLAEHQRRREEEEED